MKDETYNAKAKIVKHILSQETYSEQSGLYLETYYQMMKLPMKLLKNLELLVVLKVVESNELDRKVQKLLNK